MSLIVAFSFARAAGRKNYKTLSYKTLPSEEEIIALSAYDGRDYGIITPVKDQGSTNLCWAYSSVAASEASIVRSGLKKLEEVNLNPTAAAYRVNNRLGKYDSEKDIEEQLIYEPYYDDGIIAIDACTVRSGKVNCLVIED